MLVSIKNMTGQQVGEIELNDSIFAAPVNESLMHQALLRQLSNARLGTHKTKDRSEVRGGGRKPWRQKGTGRARQGSIRAPQWVGGGTVFGPQPRKYTKAMPKKMRRAALRSALSVKASAGQIVVVDEFSVDAPKTKAMIQTLQALEVDSQSVLMILAERNDSVQRSARNLQSDKRHKVKMLLAGYLNIRDLLGFDTILLSKDAVEHIDYWLAIDGSDDEIEEMNGFDGDAENSSYAGDSVADEQDTEAATKEAAAEVDGSEAGSTSMPDEEVTEEE